MIALHLESPPLARAGWWRRSNRSLIRDVATHACAQRFALHAHLNAHGPAPESGRCGGGCAAVDLRVNRGGQDGPEGEADDGDDDGSHTSKARPSGEGAGGPLRRVWSGEARPTAGLDDELRAIAVDHPAGFQVAPRSIRLHLLAERQEVVQGSVDIADALPVAILAWVGANL